MTNPHDSHLVIRAHGPAYHEQETGIYFVGRYDLVRAVLLDSARFSSAIDRAAMRVGGVPDAVRQIKAVYVPSVPTLSQNDNTATHDAYRKIVGPWFLPRDLESLHGFVQARTNELLDTIADRGECDFVADFAVPLPISVIRAHLGFDDVDDATVKRWSDTFADDIGLLTSEARAIEVAQLGLEAQQYMLRLCAERRRNPRADVCSN